MPAGADPGAAERDRAGDRVAARDRREPAPQPRPPGARRASPWSSVLIAFGVTSSVTALMMFGFGGFVLGRDRPGVLARRARAARGRARVRAGRAGVAGAPQPAPLRRLHRARRDRRAVRRRGRLLELQGHPRRRAQPRAERAASAARSSRTSSRPPSCTRRRTAASSGSRSAPSCASTARPMHTSKDYFPSQDPELGPVSRFFDGEATTEVALDASLGQGHLGRRRAGHREAAPAPRGGRPAVRQRRGRPLGRGLQPVPGARPARADRRLREQPAAGALPVRGQPDGHLDLARRADRDARRACSPAGRRRAG